MSDEAEDFFSFFLCVTTEAVRFLLDYMCATDYYNGERVSEGRMVIEKNIERTSVTISHCLFENEYLPVLTSSDGFWRRGARAFARSQTRFERRVELRLRKSQLCRLLAARRRHVVDDA